MFTLDAFYKTLSVIAFVAILTGFIVKAKLVPLIEIDEQTIDCGTISRGQVVERPITVRNVGYRPLTIYKIWTSCTCTATSLSSTVIPAKGTGSFRVKLVGVIPVGKMDEFVRIESNDPHHKLITLSVKALVDPYNQVEPSRIDFGMFQRHELPLHQLVTLSPVLGHPLVSNLQIKTNVNYLRGSLVRTLHPDQYRLYVELTDEAPDGNIDGNIWLLDPKCEWQYVIPISGKVIGSWRAQPEVLFFGRIENQQKPSKDFVIISSSNDLKDPKIQILPTSAGKYLSAFYLGDQKFRIIIAKDAPDGQITADIQISSFSDKTHYLNVPLYADISRKGRVATTQK